MSRVQFIRGTAVKMMGSYIVLILFALLVEGDADEVKAVTEGDLVTLNTSVTKKHEEVVRWHFNGVLIALINGDANKSCVYYGEGGRFRDRLEVDYDTGSLIITNIIFEHAGRYEAELIGKDSSGTSVDLKRPRKCDRTKTTPKSSNRGIIIKSFSLTVSASKADTNEEEPQKAPQNQKIDITVPDSGLSSGVIAGIFIVVLLVAAAVGGVMIYRRRSSRNDKKKKQSAGIVSNDEKQNEERHMI